MWLWLYWLLRVFFGSGFSDDVDYIEISFCFYMIDIIIKIVVKENF